MNKGFCHDVEKEEGRERKKDEKKREIEKQEREERTRIEGEEK